MRHKAKSHYQTKSCSQDRYSQCSFRWLGWQKYAVVSKSAIQIKINPNEVPLSANLGALGLNGITAFAGLVDICKPKTNETIVVTTA